MALKAGSVGSEAKQQGSPLRQQLPRLAIETDLLYCLAMTLYDYLEEYAKLASAKALQRVEADFQL